MNAKLMLLSVEGAMLGILNEELPEYESWDARYKASMDALERLMGMSLVLRDMVEDGVEVTDDFNIFRDNGKIEKALREASDKLNKETDWSSAPEVNPGADRDGDDLDFDDYRKELKEGTERIFIADGWLPRRSSIGSLHMVIDGLAYSYESYLETIGPIDDLEGIWVDF